MKYQVISALKVRTPFGVRELKSGDLVALPEDMALGLIEGGKVKLFCPDCFSPDGLLEAAFMEALVRGWTDDKLLTLIDEHIQTGALKTPWGFKVKDSPVIGGDFWIISDTMARERIPAGTFSFTTDELRPIVETSKVFPGSKVVKAIGPNGKDGAS